MRAPTTSTCGAPGRRRREFLYVDDAAEGIVLGAERYDGAEPVNLGVGQEITIRELVELIARLTGFAGEIRWDATQARRPAAPRARHEPSPGAFGFVAQTTFEDGLRRTIAAYAQASR